MLNLIRKDIVLQRKTLMILLPFLLVYLLLDTSSIWVGFIFSIVIITNAFSFDEKSSIKILLNSMPFTRRQIVSSKYIGVFIFTILVVLTILIGNFIFHREITPWKEQLFILILVMTVTSFILPFSYKFKSKYLLIASLVLFAIYMLIVSFIVNNLNDKIRELMQTLLTLQNPQLYIMIVTSVIAIYACSWLLSIQIYRKRVL